MITREPIYAALFALLAGSAGYTVTERRLRHWNDVEPSEQPYLALQEGRQLGKTDTGKPTIWTLDCNVYIYCRTDGGAAPGPILNPLLDAIEAALAPLGGVSVQTLGGLVHYARIEGAIETDEGTLGDQAVAIIPIQILVS